MKKKHSNRSLGVNGYTLGAVGFEKDISEEQSKKNPSPIPPEADPTAPIVKQRDVFPDLDLDLLDSFFFDKLTGYASPLFD